MRSLRGGRAGPCPRSRRTVRRGGGGIALAACLIGLPAPGLEAQARPPAPDPWAGADAPAGSPRRDAIVGGILGSGVGAGLGYLLGNAATSGCGYDDCDVGGHLGFAVGGWVGGAIGAAMGAARAGDPPSIGRALLGSTVGAGTALVGTSFLGNVTGSRARPGAVVTFMIVVHGTVTGLIVAR